MTLTKANIVASVHHDLGLPKSESAQSVESLLGIIKKTLANSEDVVISGFGKFCVKYKGEQKGRNPQTGEDTVLGSRRVVVFKCSGKLRDKINEKSYC
ncbi:MAG: integration host factor subunit alpha [Deltaproteobacteria bacterium]|nr:integration host factor subunit alpha [Deltaproteobacteria bacterium]MBW2019212.1 integration host factor subunit alpha [Deltaproteobacteria bacterium]MBW2074018.1 integration host factor subunit alpha [Deltaproteobacteria bacterium]RLB80368.1 MAG: integration host factor subunit alpha [Deltaproteobacteria bacterium]